MIVQVIDENGIGTFKCKHGPTISNDSYRLMPIKIGVKDLETHAGAEEIVALRRKNGHDRPESLVAMDQNTEVPFWRRQ